MSAGFVGVRALSELSWDLDGAGLIGAVTDRVRHDDTRIQNAVTKPEVESAWFPSRDLGRSDCVTKRFTRRSHELMLQADRAADEDGTKPEAHAAMKTSFVIRPVAAADRYDVTRAAITVPLVIRGWQQGSTEETERHEVMVTVIRGERCLHHAGVDGDVILEEQESVRVVGCVMNGMPCDSFDFDVASWDAGADDDGGCDAGFLQRGDALVTKAASVPAADVTDHDGDGISHHGQHTLCYTPGRFAPTAT